MMCTVYLLVRLLRQDHV